MHKDIESVLFSEQQLKKRIHELGKQISKDYAGRHLFLIGILNGAVIFFSQLAMEIGLHVGFDFMSVSSYGASSETSGVVRVLKDLDKNIEDRDVLIIEDIIDSGLTLKHLLALLSQRRPKSIRTCVLFDKVERRQTKITPDYCGFIVPDEFLVGFGLDYDEKYRNLPYAGILKREVYAGD